MVSDRAAPSRSAENANARAARRRQSPSARIWSTISGSMPGDPGPRGELHRAGSSVPARREARVDLALEFLGEAGLHEVRDGADGERRVLEIRLEVVPGQDDDWDGGRVGAALKFADSAPAV